MLEDKRDAVLWPFRFRTHYDRCGPEFPSCGVFPKSVGCRIRLETKKNTIHVLVVPLELKKL